MLIKLVLEARQPCLSRRMRIDAEDYAHAVFEIAARSGKVPFAGHDGPALISVIGGPHVSLEARSKHLRNGISSEVALAELVV